MQRSRSSKTVKKSSYWHKHGRRKFANQEIAIMRNKVRRLRFETNWFGTMAALMDSSPAK